jgi:hypothetical protein
MPRNLNNGIQLTTTLIYGFTVLKEWTAVLDRV